MTLRQMLLDAINALKKDVVKMADLALTNIKDSLEAFKNDDETLAKSVIIRDDEVDRMEEEIAKAALRIIWKEQPLASDLRLVTGILKLITDLERIGDHATDIAEITLHLNDVHSKRLIPTTTKMSQIAESMVLRSIDALIKVDEKIAQEVIKQDDEIDQLFNTLIRQISQEIKEEKRDPDYAMYVLMVAKYIERVGDHAVNIAEWVIFMVQGTHKKTSLF